MTVERAHGRGALRRARGQAVLRRAGGLHHRRAAGGDGARGPRGRRRRPPGDRRHQPGRGRPRLDPRRLRPRGPDQPRARLGLAPSRPRARSAIFFPELAEPRPGSSSPRGRPSGGRSSSSSASPFEVVVPERRGADRGRAARAGGGERAAQGARRWRASSCSAPTPPWCWTGAILGKPRRRGRGARPSCARLSGRDARGVVGDRAGRRGRERTAAASTARHASAPRTPPRSTGTWPPGSGASGPAATRSRAGARPWWSASRATTERGRPAGGATAAAGAGARCWELSSRPPSLVCRRIVRRTAETPREGGVG